MSLFDRIKKAKAKAEKLSEKSKKAKAKGKDKRSANLEKRKEKRDKNRSFRENKPVKKLKGGNKIVLGGSQESSCSVKGKKSKHRKPCKLNV